MFELVHRGSFMVQISHLMKGNKRFTMEGQPMYVVLWLLGGELNDYWS